MLDVELFAANVRRCSAIICGVRTLQRSALGTEGKLSGVHSHGHTGAGRHLCLTKELRRQAHAAVRLDFHERHGCHRSSALAGLQAVRLREATGSICS
ncbi:MAG: hypothetical protein ABSA52_17675 [Candidatus Binatia bacterium]